MKWKKEGVIFTPDNNYEWMVSHAQIPIPVYVDDDVLRIYFSTRDKRNRSVTAFVEVDANNPQKILRVCDKPALGLGELGGFDDDGAMPCWVVNFQGAQYLYYTGWNAGGSVPYRLAIGLAISHNGGESFERFNSGLIMDRTNTEPHFSAGPCVLIDQGVWKMWYLSCTKWEVINGKPEPFYHVKYAESADGINWLRTGDVCIDYDDFIDAIGRPCVIVEDGIYKMFYSYRNSNGYRNDPKQSYRIGYAESTDGIRWDRKDAEVGLERSSSGWDSEMMCYCSVYTHKGKKYMFYNGNGFGRSGFGYAVLVEK